MSQGMLSPERNPESASQTQNTASASGEKLAWVVGGTSGIGLAVAEQLSRSGWRVVIMGRDAHAGSVALTRLYAAAAYHSFCQTDVADASSFQHCLESLLTTCGCPEVVFYNAGRDCPGRIEERTLGQWDVTMDTNVRGAYLLLHTVVPLMRQKHTGTIVVNASIKGLIAHAGDPIYCASKAALIMLVRSIALDVAKDGIRINAICPGPVDTRLLYQKEAAVQKIPMGRVATPDEIRDSVLFLLSSSSSYITGAAIPIDGGKSSGLL
jgi:NAD(P)-dependent dehydrogenase (short-subunit alcohol dehydrogenase family)